MPSAVAEIHIPPNAPPSLPIMGQLTTRAVQALAGLNSDTVESAQLLGSLAAGITKAATERNLVFSFETVDHAKERWRIVATTASPPAILDTEPPGTEFSFAEGLTGWFLRAKRKTYVGRTRRDIPDQAIAVLQQHVEGAVIVAVPSHGRTETVVCVVTDQPGGISHEDILETHKIARLIEAYTMVANDTAQPSDAIATQPGISETLVPDWLRRVLPDQHGIVHYWEWDPIINKLRPKVIRSRATYHDELLPLDIGQGFVGTSANRVMLGQAGSIYEPRIIDGRGTTTEINTPFPHLNDCGTIRSLYAAPVTTGHAFFGVIVAVEDSFDAFDVSERQRLDETARVLATHLEWQRSARLKKMRSISFTSSNHSHLSMRGFWQHVKSVLGRPQLHHAWTNLTVIEAANANTWQIVYPSSDPDTSAVLHPSVVADITRCPSGFVEPHLWRRCAPTLDMCADERVWIRSYPHPDSRSSDGKHIVFLVPAPTLGALGLLTEEEFKDLAERTLDSLYAAHRSVYVENSYQTIAAERDRILALQTHDFLQPLNTARSDMKHILDNNTLSSRPAREAAARIIQKFDQLARQAETMLASNVLSSIHNSLAPQDRERINIRAILEDVVDHFRKTYPDQQLVFSPLTSDGQCYMLGRRNWLDLVIRNLLDNARKFGQSQPIQLQMQFIESMESKNKSRILISIMDRGIGIPKNEIRQVFSPGFQSRHTRAHHVRGSATALATCRAIIEFHGGKIWLESQIDCFTRVKIDIPVMMDGHDNRMSDTYENPMG